MTSAGENNVQVFRLSKANQYQAAIMLLVLIAASIFMIHTLGKANLGMVGIVWMTLFSITLAGGVLFLMFYAACINKNRVEIAANEIRYVGVFKTDVMAFSEVKGFQVVRVTNLKGQEMRRYIEIAPINPGTRTMKIPFDYERMPDMVQSLSFLPDLAAVERYETNVEIFKEMPGATPEEKAARFLKFGKHCKILNRASIAVALYATAFPHPYGIVIAALITLPLVAVFYLHTQGGVARIGFDWRETPRPSVMTAFLVPTTALCFRAFFDWSVLEWGPLNVPFLLIGGVVFLLLFRWKWKDFVFGNFVLYGMLSALYALGVTLFLNLLMGWSPMVANRF